MLAVERRDLDAVRLAVTGAFDLPWSRLAVAERTMASEAFDDVFCVACADVDFGVF